MARFREKPEKGDPKIKILLPKIVKKIIYDTAKNNHNSRDTEIIRRINATFTVPEAYKNIERFLKPIVLEIYNS